MTPSRCLPEWSYCILTAGLAESRIWHGKWLTSLKVQRHQDCHFPVRSMLYNIRLLATWISSKRKWNLLYVCAHSNFTRHVFPNREYVFEGQLKGIYYQKEPFKRCWTLLLRRPGPVVTRFARTTSCWSVRAQPAWETSTCLYSLG